jgi:hypothetical protein
MLLLQVHSTITRCVASTGKALLALVLIVALQGFDRKDSGTTSSLTQVNWLLTGGTLA